MTSEVWFDHEDRSDDGENSALHYINQLHLKI